MEKVMMKPRAVLEEKTKKFSSKSNLRSQTHPRLRFLKRTVVLLLLLRETEQLMSKTNRASFLSTI
jgi:transposase